MPVLTETANTPEAWSGRASAPSSWEAAGWSEHGQAQRFAAALSHLRMKPWQSVLDFGCGTGAFADLLPAKIHYYGVDWAEALIERARRERPFSPQNRRTFVCADAPPEGAAYDHIVAIGTFNLPGSEAEKHLGRLWDRTKQSLIVSLYCGSDERCLRYDPGWALAQARMLVCSDALIDGDYLENDFLLVMRRS